MATGPDPGWYDDGHGKQRWWNGSQWTEQYIDLNDREIELHAGATPVEATASAGWHDDGRGRQRWWDGVRWTDAVRFSGSEESFAGIVVDGKWIHFGAASQPAGGATASVQTGADLLRRGRLSRPATARVLYGPSGLITPRLLPMAVNGSTSYVFVEVGGQIWLAAVPAGEDARARQFVGWITSVSEHYRYR